MIEINVPCRRHRSPVMTVNIYLLNVILGLASGASDASGASEASNSDDVNNSSNSMQANI